MAEQMLKRLSLDLPLDRPLRTLGIAEQQMIEVAKALSRNARILIMDEPTSALTAGEIRELFDSIRRLKGEGVAIIYISHRLEELLEIGDRVTVLRDGHAVATQAISEVTVPGLIRLMVNRDLKEQFPRKPVPRGPELLRVEHLSQKSISGISVSVSTPGRSWAGGLVGSGRSRLARALFGAEPLDSGAVYWQAPGVKSDHPGTPSGLELAISPRTGGITDWC